MLVLGVLIRLAVLAGLVWGVVTLIRARRDGRLHVWRRWVRAHTPVAYVVRLVRWAVWSPRRAVITLASVVAALLVLTVAGASLGGSTPAAKAQPAATDSPTTPPDIFGTPTASPSASPVAGEDNGGAPTTPDASVVAAKTFTKQWLAGRTARTTKAWLATMRATADPTLKTILPTTNRALIPAAAVYGATITGPGDYAVEVTVTLTNATQLVETLAYDGALWRVTGIAPKAA